VILGITLLIYPKRSSARKPTKPGSPTWLVSSVAFEGLLGLSCPVFPFCTFYTRIPYWKSGKHLPLLLYTGRARAVPYRHEPRGFCLARSARVTTKIID